MERWLAVLLLFVDAKLVRYNKVSNTRPFLHRPRPQKSISDKFCRETGHKKTADFPNKAPDFSQGSAELRLLVADLQSAGADFRFQPAKRLLRRSAATPHPPLS